MQDVTVKQEIHIRNNLNIPETRTLTAESTMIVLPICACEACELGGW